ncbi:type VII secretion system-associated protein [Streptomyces sp. NPDC050161]|uniref:type VII secretion system-associated protein n=1 Tax=Streptomyces sp. NPDC050161 TaxID=3365604 RepID=UPI0037A2E8A7
MDDSTQTTVAVGVPVTGQEMPEPPPEVIEAARSAPDHWLAMVDLTWTGEGPPPRWALIGQWRSGPTGEIEEWRDNPEYRPSPQMLDWADPTDPVDQAVQLAATGYGPAQDVPDALARAQVSVLVSATGSPLAAASPEGTPVVPVYTSDSHLESVGRLLYDRRPVAELVGQLPPGHAMYLNPTGPVSMLVDMEELHAALSAAGAGAADEDGAADGGFALVDGPAAPRRPGTAAGGAEPVGAHSEDGSEDGVAGPAGGLPIGKPARTAAVGAGMASSGARGRTA